MIALLACAVLMASCEQERSEQLLDSQASAPGNAQYNAGDFVASASLFSQPPAQPTLVRRPAVAPVQMRVGDLRALTTEQGPDTGPGYVVPFPGETPTDIPLPLGAVKPRVVADAPFGAEPAPLAPLPGDPSPLPQKSFAALGDANTAIPPDTHGAAGPTHLMTTLNTEVRIQDRDGAVISTVSLNTWWASVRDPSPDTFDPKVLYDHGAGRWMLTACANSRGPDSALVMAVSATSDPTGLWHLYYFDGDPDDILWVDYPSMGFNKDYIAVNVNMFPVTELAGAFENHTYIFKKADLYAGSAVTPVVDKDLSGWGTNVPAITHSATETNLYMVANIDGNYEGGYAVLGLSRIYPKGGDVDDPVLEARYSFPNLNQPFDTYLTDRLDFAPQLGSEQKIQTNDGRIQNAVFRNGSLWTTHTAYLAVGGSPTRTAVYWWQLQVDGTQAPLQWGSVGGTDSDFFYAFPSIAVNASNDVLIGYTRYAADQYAHAAYSFRYGTDPANGLRGERVLKDGEAPYYKTFGGDRNRWGDYSSTVVDPLDDDSFWTIQEYASTPSEGYDRWGTWWGQIAPCERTDASCDGIDDDCDGEVDEDYVSSPTSCGTGACARSGVLSCEGGELIDSCQSGVPAELDESCNGIDEDCDGTADEDYVPTATSCGVGACAASGSTACVSGAVTDDCVPLPESIETCNGLDDNCDGAIDENGAALCDDSDACTETDMCVDGLCVNGDTVECGAPDDCWVAGSCDPGTGLCSDPTPADDLRCDDGNPCTRIACLGDDCVVHPFGDGTPCDDGDACTVGETCRFAICWGGEPLDCDDGEACTLDLCDPELGCVQQSICCTEDSDCDDEDPRSVDWCDLAAGECQHELISCDDQDACTTDVLMPDGSCENSDCDDGDSCTVDACNPFVADGMCFFLAMDCDDGDSCTVDACDPGSGKCMNEPAPDGILCDDADPCTEADQCAKGECFGVVRDCDDGDPCTLDACDAATGACAHVVTPCDGDLDGDGVPDLDDCEPEDEAVFPGADERCNYIDDDCDGSTDEDVLCCDADADCDDGNPCTVHLCDQGTCGPTEFLNDVDCEDGDACTTGERCIQGLCWGGVPLPCDDSDACTTDACDPIQGCVFSPSCCQSDAACDDQDPRTVDWCDLGSESCVYERIGCDDRDGCTMDVLLPDGTCLHEACDDDDPCTEDRCYPFIAEGICYFVPVDCDDGNSCTLDTCDPTSGACGHQALPEDSPCDDADACSLDDLCTGGACVGSAVTCDDGDACTLGVCDSLSGDCAFLPAPCPGDQDGDGWVDDEDCEPTDPTAHPEAAERCNAMDDDCDGETDETLLCCESDADCDRGNDCEDFACVDGACELDRRPDFAACEDGEACTSGDYCIYGFCWGGAATDCDDGDACSYDSCGLLSGCVHEPSCCDDDGDCDDLLPITTDWCDVAAGVCRYEIIGCDDGDGCTADFLLADGSCEHIGCDDGDPCTVDACNPFVGESGFCYAYAKDCDDREPCTLDACDPGTGACAHEALLDGTSCEDADLCTDADLCQAGVCGGAAVDCDDSDPCTTDVCLPAIGVCDHGPGACDGDEDGDGVADGIDCAPTDPLGYPGAPERCNDLDDDCDGAVDEGLRCCDLDTDCEDGNPCSGDRCLDGECHRFYMPDGTVCADNGMPCSVGSVCVFGTCWGGAPVDCDDGDACTADRCEPLSGACVSEPLCDCPEGCVDGVCAPPSLDPVTPAALDAALVAHGFLLINVHVPYAGEIPGTDAHVAYTDLPGLLAVVGADLSQPIVVYCRTDAMALVAGQALVDLGYCAVRYLDGGMNGWEAAGFSLAE